MAIKCVTIIVGLFFASFILIELWLAPHQVAVVGQTARERGGFRGRSQEEFGICGHGARVCVHR